MNDVEMKQVEKKKERKEQIPMITPLCCQDSDLYHSTEEALNLVQALQSQLTSDRTSESEFVFDEATDINDEGRHESSDGDQQVVIKRKKKMRILSTSKEESLEGASLDNAHNYNFSRIKTRDLSQRQDFYEYF